MAKFTDQELSEKASAVYAEAEQHYKGSEINVDILMRIAKEYFDFDEEQLNQLGRYFEIEELAFIDIDDIDVDKLQYVSAEEIEAMKQGREEVKGSDLDRIEAFLLNREGYTTELADSILTQLYNTFKGLTKTEESLEEEKEIVEEALPSNDELPDMCYVYVESDNTIGIVKKGEVGYYPATNVDPNLTTPEEKRAFVRDRNNILEIDERTEEIMKTKSMFGWGDKKEEAISEEDVKSIFGIDQMITDLQSKYKLNVIGSYDDNSIELQLKGDTLPLIDAMDYIKDALAGKTDCRFSDKVNDTITCTISK